MGGVRDTTGGVGGHTIYAAGVMAPASRAAESPELTPRAQAASLGCKQSLRGLATRWAWCSSGSEVVSVWSFVCVCVGGKSG